MAKRKTSCGNARKCSMLPISVTRSASYEALPNRRLFPAKYGLTSRVPLRNCCLCRRRPRVPWRQSAASNELLWKSEMHLRSNKSGDAVGRPSCRSWLLGDPGAKFLVETGHPNRTMKNSLNYVSTCLKVVDTRRWVYPGQSCFLSEFFSVVQRRAPSFRHRFVDASHGSLWPSGKRLAPTPECARCRLPTSPGALRTKRSRTTGSSQRGLD